DTRAFFRDVAEGLEYEVAEVGTRNEFMSAYDAFGPTVILLDLSMPDVDGVEILRELSQRNCSSPVLLASGQDEHVISTVQRLGLMLGLEMKAVLQKPVSVDALETVLGHVRDDTAAITPEILERAIGADEFILHYQPKIDLQGGEDYPVIGGEALVRWMHPRRGLLAPGEFLPLLEEYGLIGPLTEKLVKRAVGQLESWRRQGLSLPVSVNLSPRQLTDLSLPDRIAKLMSDAALDPAMLVLEITEQSAMADISAATEILTRLRLKNIAVSLDDFGSGYSSLAEIYRMPLSELKIDRSLIVDLDQSAAARTVMKGIQALAREMKLPICAEGVETAKTAGFLHSIGCPRAQGFLFSKPLPPEDYFKFAINNAGTRPDGKASEPRP
ncbi:MAG: EAL domain-containing protein, partial [Wenzhouxiangellaceae bacterium]